MQGLGLCLLHEFWDWIKVSHQAWWKMPYPPRKLTAHSSLFFEAGFLTKPGVDLLASLGQCTPGFFLCSRNNKNPETDIGVQPEDQKSKAAKPLESSYLYEIFRLKDSEFLSYPTLYSSLVL